MKTHISTLTFTLPLAVALSVTSVQGASWIGGGVGSEYLTPGNWDDGLVPSSGSTQNINGPYTVTRSGNTTAGRTFVRGGAVLNVPGGNHDDDISDANKWNLLGEDSKGTINQSGGTYEIGHGLRIGVGKNNSANSDGLYNQTGGDLVIYRAGNSKTEPSNPGGRTSMEIGDTAGAGLYQISGGSLRTRTTVHIAEAGTFRVIGSGASSIGIGSEQSGDGGWLQKGLLSMEIDAGGVTSIFVDDTGGGVGIAEFYSGSLLDLDFAAGVTPYGGTWTLMEVEGTNIVDSGLALSSLVDPAWSFDIDNSGTNGVLTATFVPEPGTYALLFGLAGLGLVWFRRSRLKS